MIGKASEGSPKSREAQEAKEAWEEKTPP